jgi:hypothetical protein
VLYQYYCILVLYTSAVLVLYTSAVPVLLYTSAVPVLLYTRIVPVLWYTSIVPVLMYTIYSGCLIRSMDCLRIASTWVHPTGFFGVRVGHFFSFLCWPIVFLYVPSSITIFALKQRSVRLYLQLFVGAHVLSTVFVFCFSSSCVAYVANFSELSIVDCYIPTKTSFSVA